MKGMGRGRRGSVGKKIRSPVLLHLRLSYFFRSELGQLLGHGRRTSIYLIRALMKLVLFGRRKYLHGEIGWGVT